VPQILSLYWEMLLRLLVKDRDKRRRIAHIAAGVIILIHAYEKYESDHQSYIFFIIAGLIFLTIALLHPLIEKKAPWIDGIFLVIEGILSIVVAIDYFGMGKKALPIAYLMLAVFQFFMAFRKSKKGIKQHKLSQLK
jgi:hypothetical protein